MHLDEKNGSEASLAIQVGCVRHWPGRLRELEGERVLIVLCISGIFIKSSQRTTGSERQRKKIN